MILLSLLPARKNEVFVSHGGNYKSKGSEFAANSGNAARIAKYTFKRVKKFIAVSNSQKTALIVNAGVPRRKVFTVFNGVKRPENYALSYNFHEDTISISIIGYIKRLKNQTLLLDVIKNLINAGLKCKLNIFGAIADEEYDKELNSKIQRLGIENNVEFFGYVSDKDFIYNNSDIVVSCSFHEGFGLSIVEAMAYGKPTIAYAKSEGPASIIKSNVTGILVQKNLLEEYTKAILQYCNNTNFTKEVVDNALREFDNKFSLNSMVERYERIIEGV